MRNSQLTDRESVDPLDLVAQDAEDQRVVLAFLLGRHPARLTIPHIAQELYADLGDFKSENAVERAIRDLVGRGLLRCQGRFLLLTSAMLHLDRRETE